MKLVPKDGSSAILPVGSYNYPWLVGGFDVLMGGSSSSAGMDINWYRLQIVFSSVPQGVYDVVLEEEETGRQVVKTLEIFQDNGNITEQNEAGFKVIFDGQEAPFDNYGRHFATIGNESISSIVAPFPWTRSMARPLSCPHSRALSPFS